MQETETQYIKNKVRKEIAVTIWRQFFCLVVYPYFSVIYKSTLWQ